MLRARSSPDVVEPVPKLALGCLIQRSLASKLFIRDVAVRVEANQASGLLLEPMQVLLELLPFLLALPGNTLVEVSQQLGLASLRHLRAELDAGQQPAELAVDPFLANVDLSSTNLDLCAVIGGFLFRLRLAMETTAALLAPKALHEGVSALMESLRATG